MPSDTIIKAAENLLRNTKNITIAIDGRCASGKTTLAEKISQAVDCNVIHTDDFFLPHEQKTTERLSQAGGNIDYERLYNEIILPLKEKTSFSYRAYNCSSGKLSEYIYVKPKPITIIEGTYSLHPHFKEYADLKVFMDVSESEQKQRLKIRNIRLYERFINEWIPMEEHYFNEFAIRKKCDLIFK